MVRSGLNMDSSERCDDTSNILGGYVNGGGGGVLLASGGGRVDVKPLRMIAGGTNASGGPRHTIDNILGLVNNNNNNNNNRKDDMIMNNSGVGGCDVIIGGGRGNSLDRDRSTTPGNAESPGKMNFAKLLDFSKTKLHKNVTEKNKTIAKNILRVTKKMPTKLAKTIPKQLIKISSKLLRNR